MIECVIFPAFTALQLFGKILQPFGISSDASLLVRGLLDRRLGRRARAGSAQNEAA